MRVITQKEVNDVRAKNDVLGCSAKNAFFAKLLLGFVHILTVKVEPFDPE